MEKFCSKFGSVEKRRAQASGDAELERCFTVFQAALMNGVPGQMSRRERAVRWAELLSTPERECSHRTVEGWLDGAARPSFRYFIPVLMLAGVELVFEMIDPEA